MSDTRSDIEIPETGLVPEAPAVEQVQSDRPPTPRELAMEAIIAKAERVRQSELQQFAGVEEVPSQSREDHSATRRANPELGEQEEDREYEYRSPYAKEDEPPPVVVEPPPPKPTAAGPITVNLDGHDIQVSQEQLVQLARMGMIANQTIGEYQRYQAAPQVQIPPARQPPEATFDQDIIRNTVKRIQYGTEDDAAEALGSLIKTVVENAPRQQQIDPVQVGHLAARIATNEARMAAEAATIQKEYAELFSREDWRQLAAWHVDKVRHESNALGIQRSDLDTFREAGNRTLASVGRPQPGSKVDNPAPAGQTPASQASGPSVRRSPDINARKREVPRQTSSVVDRRAPAPETSRAPSGTDIVEMMRKGRGQTPMR